MGADDADMPRHAAPRWPAMATPAVAPGWHAPRTRACGVARPTMPQARRHRRCKPTTASAGARRRPTPPADASCHAGMSTTPGSAVAPRTTRPGLCGPRPDVGSTAGASTPHARRTRGGLWCGAPPRRRAGAAGGPGQVIPHRDHPGGFVSPSGRVRRLMRARDGPREAGLGVGRPRRGATRRAGSPWYFNVL